MRELTYREAVREALREEMKRDQSVFLLGEEIAEFGGSHKVTLGLVDEFGHDRVRNTPIAEAAIGGAALGAAIVGMRPVAEIMFIDFSLIAMDQIINHATKWRYMFGSKQHVPLTIRSIIGRGWGSAAQHSQSLQGLFLHVPGLKIVMPSSAYDVKGLLLASIADPDPVLFIEHRWLYEIAEHVPEEMYTIPIGKGIIRRKGKDVTVVAVSYMVFEAMHAAKQLYEKEGIDIEVLDMRAIKPLDEDLLFASVKKTGRLIIADTGWKTGGITAEIAARVSEKIFSHLKAPIKRVALPDTPTPASPVLEKAYYPGKKEIITAINRVIHADKRKKKSNG